MAPAPQVMGQTVVVRVTVLVTAGLEEAPAETPAGRDELGALGVGMGATGEEAEGEPVTAGVVAAAGEDSGQGVVDSAAGVEEASGTEAGVEEALGTGVLLSEQGTVSVSVTVPVTVLGGVAVGAGVVEATEDELV